MTTFLKSNITHYKMLETENSHLSGDKDHTAAKPLSKKNKRKQKNKSRTQRYKERQPKPDYAPIVKDNANFVSYYKLQSFLEDGEFDKFMEGLRETLPASFRINTFDANQAEFLRRLVQGPELYEFLEQPARDEPIKDNIDQEPSEGQDNPLESSQAQKPAVLAPLCWYPDKLGWQMNTTRLDLKRSPILQQFHRFLMAETDNGFISRQEAVSMIPPLVLDIHQGQDVLDMCAAPGSKTAQLLEYLKRDPLTTKDVKPIESVFNDGMVVANDVDNKRCYMLVHQSSRLNSPNCIIINQDAARIYDIKIANKEGQESIIKFDRILCDVPCSGDGTLRKNPDVWKKWTVGNANNFHGMQCKILKRGLELLKRDGKLTYSTCSMNPVEDEAVISNILRLSKGTVALEDIASKLPGLKFRPGVSEWVVMNKEMQAIPAADKVPPENATQIYPSLFPPTKEESEKFQLHKCIRVLPHLQNTGGFFVATLRKLVDQLPWEIESQKKVSESADSQNETAARPLPNPKKRKFAGFKEDPFMFMTTDDPDWIAIKNGYGFSDEFPVDQLMHRCVSGKKRSIYLVSKRVRDFIISNREEVGREDFVKIINGGMRLFSRADTEAGFRICQDGVNEILPFVKSEIKVPINRADLVALIKAKSVAFDRLSAAQQIKDTIKYGCLVLIYRDTIEESNQNIEMPLVAWKGEHTIALYVSKTYRIHLCALTQVKISDDGMLNPPDTVKNDDQ